MLRHLLQIPNRSKLFRQSIAALLLLFFAWDIVLDSAPPVHAVQDLPGDPVVSISSGRQDNTGNTNDGDPDCGMPDHGCALSHHHHFPAVLSSTNVTILVAALLLAKSDKVPATGHSPLSHHPIRAPPCI